MEILSFGKGKSSKNIFVLLDVLYKHVKSSEKMYTYCSAKRNDQVYIKKFHIIQIEPQKRETAHSISLCHIKDFQLTIYSDVYMYKMKGINTYDTEC